MPPIVARSIFIWKNYNTVRFKKNDYIGIVWDTRKREN
jgi:hypothetical protein